MDRRGGPVLRGVVEGGGEMKVSFEPSLGAVLIHEGGFVCNPHDPGGATNQGVTQAVYDNWRSSRGLPTRTVREIERAEVETIYRDLYWNRVRGDDLPAGVDYAVFDFAFNSGVSRAARFLQQAVGAVPDGAIGPVTLALVKAQPVVPLIDSLCDLRLNFLQSLHTFRFFGRGWTRRVAEVRERAKEMAA